MNYRGTCTIKNSILSGNSSQAVGGGIWNYPSSVMVIQNSLIAGNSAPNGGALRNEGDLTATNSTFCGNSGGVGGGIDNLTGTLTLDSCTIAGNSATSAGGGVFNHGATIIPPIPAAKLGIRNSIVAGNTAASVGPDCLGTFNSLDYNLIQDTNGCVITNLTVHNIYNQAPLLGPLADNGGPTMTRALLAGSPAIDQGHSGGLTTDQRGLPRPIDDPNTPNAPDGDGSDIGAYEADVYPPPVVADFAAELTSGVAPLTVSFTNLSSGAINYSWDFGDGNTSVSVNPTNTYTNAGSYTVSLTAVGAGGTNSLTRTNYVVVTIPPPPPPVSGYVQAVTNASPVAYWRLNETNGATVAADLLGFHNGTISASVTPGVSGPRNPPFPGFETNNTAIQFNYTTGSYLTMPALNLNTNTVTICGWINPTGSQAGWTGIAFCRGGSTVAGLHFGPGSIQNELRYTWNNSRWDKSTGLAVPTGQWSFVALVVTPTNGTIYMGTNGVLNSFTDVASEPSQAFDSSLLIGYDPSEGSRLFRGIIDEVAIYNHSLTPTQIQQLYASALTTPPLPLTPFQTWQLWYFGCTNCPQAAATADPDGDGQNNLAEFLAGTDPTDSTSAFRIISVAREGNNVRVTWNTGGGTTNVLQATVGDEYGGYTNAFVDLNEPIIIPGTGDATTNSVDTGGATNCPARYYRVRLVP
jgi:PKD repeat protein